MQHQITAFLQACNNIFIVELYLMVVGCVYTALLYI